MAAKKPEKTTPTPQVAAPKDQGAREGDEQEEEDEGEEEVEAAPKAAAAPAQKAPPAREVMKRDGALKRFRAKPEVDTTAKKIPGKVNAMQLEVVDLPDASCLRLTEIGGKPCHNGTSFLIDEETGKALLEAHPKHLKLGAQIKPKDGFKDGKTFEILKMVGPKVDTSIGGKAKEGEASNRSMTEAMISTGGIKTK